MNPSAATNEQIQKLINSLEEKKIKWWYKDEFKTSIYIATWEKNSPVHYFFSNGTVGIKVNDQWQYFYEMTFYNLCQIVNLLSENKTNRQLLNFIKKHSLSERKTNEPEEDNSYKTIHDLKILESYYKAIQRGVKTFELRKLDREYKIGDYLRFKVLQKDGNEVKTTELYKIVYILKDVEKYGLAKDYGILGIKPEE